LIETQLWISDCSEVEGPLYLSSYPWHEMF
jgi:hypothetical protein